MFDDLRGNVDGFGGTSSVPARKVWMILVFEPVRGSPMLQWHQDPAQPHVLANMTIENPRFA